MYFWKIDSLTEDLKNGTLPQSERFKYLLATVVVYAVVMGLVFLFPSSVIALDFVESFFVVVITAAGTIYCYLINSRGDNQEFIDRFICIGWVVLVRLVVFFVVAYSLYLFGGSVVGGEEFERFSETTNFISVGFVLGFCAVFYWLVGKHIKKVAK